MPPSSSDLQRIFPACRRVMGEPAWNRCLQDCAQTAHSLPECLVASAAPDAPPWLAELAALEWGAEAVRRAPPPAPVERLTVHPALQILPCTWQGLAMILAGGPASAAIPADEIEFVLLWPDPEDGDVRCEVAGDEELLALKIVAEELPLADVAAQAGAPVTALRALLRRVAAQGLLLQPPSSLVRPQSTHPRPTQDNGSPALPQDVFTAAAFTLQWHITQRCDLRCRHCYDRSPRQDTPLDEGLRLLDDMAAFCETRGVQGQVTLTGGNPLLHPDVLDFSRGVAERGLHLALLGNPCTASMLDELLAIEPPVYFQVSLEGLEEHNDAIRGAGHFRRVLAFLDLLAEREVPAQVMLTLTRDNMPQVLPLARELQGRVERFTFNRLAPVGEGAALACACKDDYAAFLQDYLELAGQMSHVRCKDNLLNVALQQQGRELFGGCTGHGCGAAFNFMAVLGDGEAHACRKMYSPLGNVHLHGLAAIYDGPAAASYRAGSAACAGCELRPACGGCLAVTAGLGKDPLTQRNPYCFFPQAP